MGILYVYTQHFYLPALTLLIFYVTPRYSIILFFLFGWLFAWVHQWFILPKGLPNVPVIQKTTVQGVIASIPLRRTNKTQFTLELEQYNGHPAQGLLQLAWYTKIPDLRLGQRWKLT
jgi:competence protein ComEC